MVDYKNNYVRDKDVYRNNTVQEKILFGDNHRPLQSQGLEKKILVEFACVFD